MKELSMEEKAKAYDSLIERLKDFQFEYRFSPFSDVISDKFHELIESEDERIRKEIIHYLEITCNQMTPNQDWNCKNRWLPWLEKVGELEPKFRIGDSIKKKSTGDIVTVSEVDLKNREYRLSNTGFIPFKYEQLWELVEQKPAEEYNITGIGSKHAQGKLGEMLKNRDNNIEPKFKVGDWVTDGNITIQIEAIKNDCYLYCGDCVLYSTKTADKVYHLWTIQDARPGDVIIDKSGSRECPFIFKETKPSDIKTDILNPLAVLGYCGIGAAGFAKGSGWGDTANRIYYPATKEQREQLFKAIHEAGYMWDSESKKLLSLKAEPNVEQKSAWSEEDEKMINNIINDIESIKEQVYYKTLCDEEIDWLKSLKDRYT